MKIIEQGEKEVFNKVLARFNLPADDFELRETDTTDPKTDEVFAITGFVVVARKSTNQSIEYPIGDGSTWIERFELDVAKNLFGC
jgi:hypothetical protein